MIVFMGTPQFAVPILKMLYEAKYPIGLVVTQPDKPVGRKRILTASPVKQYAASVGLKVFQPTSLKTDYQRIIDLEPKLIITAAYGQILPKALLNEIPAINIHGSLLPKYRGGAPIQYALFNQDQKTGVTLMEMVYQMDAGDMIAKTEVLIDSQDNYETLSEKLSLAGRDLLTSYLPIILERKYQKTPQDINDVTFAYTLKAHDEKFNFNQSVGYNLGRMRGLLPHIGANFSIHGVTFKVFAAKKSDIIDTPKQNCITILQKRLIVGCLDGGFEILEIQQQGKKKMPIKDFLNGQSIIKDGDCLE